MFFQDVSQFFSKLHFNECRKGSCKEGKMPRKKSKNAVLAGFLEIVVLAVGRGAQKNPVAPSPAQGLAAPTCTLTTQPSTIEKGQSVTLSWTSQNATDMDIQPGVGRVEAQGSSRMKPDDSTTYTMTAKGPGGNITCTARVTVVVVPTGGPVPLSSTSAKTSVPVVPSVSSVAWSPDGERLAGGSSEGAAKIWGAKTGKELLDLSGRGVTWSPDGKRLATGNDGHTAKVWDAGTGKELLIWSYLFALAAVLLISEPTWAFRVRDAKRPCSNLKGVPVRRHES
jgi:WD40 repeat protein